MHKLQTALIIVLAFRQGYRWKDKLILFYFGFVWLVVELLQEVGMVSFKLQQGTFE